MSATRSVHVHNTSGVRISVPGYGALEPDDHADVPASDPVDELIGAGALSTEAAPDPLTEETVEVLELRARELGIYDEIEGTGKDGNVVKSDLVAALNAHNPTSEED